MENQLWWADNRIMEQLPPAMAQLIYMDPPFNSGTHYRLQPQKADHLRPLAFTDRWPWDEEAEQEWHLLLDRGPQALVPVLRFLQGQLDFSPTLAYLTGLARQLASAHRLLHPTGSLYLHSPTSLGHYLRLVLEAIFGRENFRNAIVWGYRTGGTSRRHFARKHDVIWFFSKSSDYFFQPVHYRSYQQKRYAYQSRYPEYYDEARGAYYHLALCRDVWDDIPAIGTTNRQRTGFPTQKPEALLERIITASSQPGQLVLDPFAGSGTTLVVAHRLGRPWLGIDRSPVAIRVTQHRLEQLGIADYQVRQEGQPAGVEGLEANP